MSASATDTVSISEQAPFDVTHADLARLRIRLEDALVEQQWRLDESQAMIDSVISGPAQPSTSRQAEVAEFASKAARTAIRRIEGALARIESGTYGTCTSCGSRLSTADLAQTPLEEVCRACRRHGGANSSFTAESN